MPDPDDVFKKCDELGLDGVEAMLESTDWGEPRKRIARAWMVLKKGEQKKEAEFKQEDQHEESIEALRDAALQLVAQMDESSAAIGEEMEALTDKVETLDERLSNLNTTIDKASKSSTYVAWALVFLTIVIAAAALLELNQ